ncbi:MAG: NTPase [Patescibacteria group bacterium]|nr:NTPase [Patescibacteria group bacterium]
MKNIFITGPPGCGKTSLIIEIIKELNLNAGGFYTQEIREKGIRKGFKIKTLNGQEGILAHVNVKSPYRVSKYGVNLQDLEEIGVKSILEALKKNKVIIIDEIGKQEMCSEKFKKAVILALNSKSKILGTIKLTSDSFTDKIKQREDTKIFYLTKENRGKIKEEIKNFLERD